MICVVLSENDDIHLSIKYFYMDRFLKSEKEKAMDTHRFALSVEMSNELK
jgi:hypothetical protein